MFRKTPKYGQKRVSHDNQSFASKLEASLYAHLRELEKKKEIKNIVAQSTVYLTKARIAYIADFQYEQDGEIVWAEAKGFETDVWRIKRRLWMHYGPGKLLVYKGSYKNLTLHETIIPKALNDD